MSAIEPYRLAIPESALDDLRVRLRGARWPERETVGDASQGVQRDDLQSLCAYWADGYDWRRCEARLNALGQYRTRIDDLDIHFLHVKSPHPDAMPLILTHGWPGSVIEFLKVIAPLTDPVAHGGDAADAFHVVIPSLPGHGFSGIPEKAGWGVQRIARCWIALMKRLGYDRFVAQGGDWGSLVTTAIGVIHPPECLAIHLNMPLAFPNPEERADWTREEAASAAAFDHFMHDGSGYSMLQRTRPQTVGYGLVDSPLFQAAWIYEKLTAWVDGDIGAVLTRDEILDNIMLYWLPGTGASAARLYWESMLDAATLGVTSLPAGVTLYPKEVLRPSRRWVERLHRNLIHWSEPAKGGHFAAFEQPANFVEEIRTCFRTVR